ncbi:MAG: hypothetical protein ACFHX7_03860 [Pseudomonadota bacterium]
MKHTNGILLGCLLLISGNAVATPITEPEQLTGPLTTIDFNSLAASGYSPTTYSLTFPGVTLSNVNHILDVDGFGAATTYPNYVSDKAVGLPDLLTSPPNFTITFDQAVSAVGFGIFDPNFAGNIIRALDEDGNVIETTSPDFLGPTGGSAADYVGFVTATPLIKSIEINAGISGSTVDALWIDNLSFTAVPSPPALLLFIVGLLMFSPQPGNRRR